MSSTNSLSATQPELNATVSASAGSGKTWLLVTRIIRLLLAGAEPGSILALTFTRKAAAEMQIRLHQRLYELAVCDDAMLDKNLQLIAAEASAETRQRARCLYEMLLHSLYPVRLQTFHSFCQDILSRFPLEADVPPGFELLENTSLLEQQAWEALFAEITDAPESELSHDLDLLMQAADGPANTRKALNSMLAHRSDWWAYTEDQAQPDAYAASRLTQLLELNEAGDASTGFFKPNTIDLLAEFARLLGKHKTAGNTTHAELLATQLAQQQPDSNTLAAIQSVFLTAKKQPRARKHSKAQEKSMTAAGEQRFLELHDMLCEKLLDTLDLQLRQQALLINQAWYRAGHRFVEIYQRLKRELRVLDFQDLEWCCYRLLNTSENALWVQYKVDQRIDHFLIDEFQDTNPTQWQLLSPLLEEMAAAPEQRWRTAFIVGDEKQSIYSFRRANPALQSQVSAWLHDRLSARPTPLDYSWRSSPAIIEFVNRVFQQDEVKTYMPDFSQHGTHLEQLAGSVEVSPLYEESEESSDPLDDEQPGLRNPLQRPRVEDLRSARTDEAEAIAQRITELVTTPASITDENGPRPVEYADIIILIRNRTHIEHYEKALRNRQIPYIGSQRGTLLDSLEIRDLEKLLDTLITPFDNLAVAQVLKSPIFSASDEDLILLAQLHGKSHWYERLLQLPEQLDRQHPLARAARLLPAWRQLADTIPVHDLLDRIYAEANILERYRASVDENNRYRVQANLQRFLELSLELDSGRYPSLSHFLHYLRSLKKPDAASLDEPVANSGESRVRLMTIHASKGLESPVVFLADCNTGASVNDAYTALVHWPANATAPENMQLLLSKDNTDTITASVQQQKAHAQAREQLNLLYVALTRARQYLYISGVATNKTASGWYQLIYKAIESVAPGNNKAMVYSYGTQQAAASSTTHSEPASKDTAADRALQSPIRCLPPVLKMIAPSRVSAYNQNPPYAGDSLDNEHGQLRGIVIHRALDLLSRERPYSVESIRQQLLSETGISSNNEELEAWIAEAMQTVENEQFSDIFRPPQPAQTRNELQLLFESGNQPVYGLVDRLVIGEEDILLVDYKTHVNADMGNIQSLAEQFREQLGLYAEGVQRLWPGHRIRQAVLFTACAQRIWLE